jgi:hypothetical protein
MENIAKKSEKSINRRAKMNSRLIWFGIFGSPQNSCCDIFIEWLQNKVMCDLIGNKISKVMRMFLIYISLNLYCM